MRVDGERATVEIVEGSDEDPVDIYATLNLSGMSQTWPTTTGP